MKNIGKLCILATFMIAVVGCGAIPTLKNGEQMVASLDKGGVSADGLYSKLKNKYGAQEFVDLLDTEILNTYCNFMVEIYGMQSNSAAGAVDNHRQRTLRTWLSLWESCHRR